MKKSNKKKKGGGRITIHRVILKKTGWKVKTGGRRLRRTAGRTDGRTAIVTTLEMEWRKTTETKDKKNDDTCAC